MSLHLQFLSLITEVEVNYRKDPAKSNLALIHTLQNLEYRIYLIELKGGSE